MSEETAQYHLLLAEAFQASENVDNYDLHSESEHNKLKFNALQIISRGKSLELIEYVYVNVEKLIAGIKINSKPIE